MSANNFIETKYMLKAQREQRASTILSKLDQFAQQETVGVEQVFLHANANAEQTGADDFISGCMMVLQPDTKVNVSFLHANMFGQVMLFPVRKLDADGKEVPIDVADFEGRESKMIEMLNHAVPEQSTSKTASKPSLRCMASPDLVEDAEEWQSVLGKNGRVGLYRTERSHDEYDYTLLVHVDQTPASLDLYRWVYELEPNELSLREFIQSPRYKFVRNLNKRNAQRLAAKAAEALGLDIPLVEDLEAYRSNEHKVYPKMAVPSLWNEYNVFESGKWVNKRAIMLYDSTVCTQRAVGGLALLEDAYSPVHVFPPTKNETQSESKGVTTNAAGFSFPYTLGIGEDLEQYLTHLNSPQSALTDRQRDQINRRVIWEGKQRFDTKWFNHRVIPDLYLHYDARDDEQASLFRSLYKHGDLSRVQTLKPVIVKISTEQYSGYDL